MYSPARLVKSLDNLNLTPQQKADFEASSAIAWIYLNNFVNENQKPMEYNDHAFLIEPMTVLTDDLCVRKSAQVGFSVAAIFKSFWLCAYKKMNVGYILPNQNVSKDFVKPKVDPLISGNPAIQRLVKQEGMRTSDSVSLKQIGDRFMYFRGAYSEASAISISLDVLILDEYDRMPNMNVVNIYDSRLQASEYAWRWRFSNPSIPAFGVDDLFNRSNQNHFFVKCSKCNHNWYMDWEETPDHNHFVDRVARVFRCGKCKSELSNHDRRTGEWVAAWPDRKAVGYWISQLQVPYVTAGRIVDQFEESSLDFFYNFVLGKAYQQADMQLDRTVVLRNMTGEPPIEKNVAIGVDVGKVKHLTIGNPTGIFKTVTVTEWEQVEYYRNKYDAVMVIDSMPDFTIPSRLVKKYPGKVFLAVYGDDKKGLGTIRWGEGDKRGMVYIDRTKAFDHVVQELTGDKFKYHGTEADYAEYIRHWSNVFRIVERNKQGHDVAKWVETQGRPDHFPHSHVYFRAALERVFGAVGAGVVETMPRQGQAQIAPTIDADGRMNIDHLTGGNNNA